MKNISSNITKYTLLLITNKRVFVAIMGVYYLSIGGVGETEIGYVLLASNVAGFLFEIPSGYLSDRIGHKKTLVISRVLMMISSLLFLVASNLFVLISASVFFSLGIAFNSGTMSAFLHETLKSLKREGEYAEIAGKAKSIGFAVPLLISVFVPFLVDINMKVPFIIGLIVDIVGFIVAILLVNPDNATEKTEEIGPQNFKEILLEGKNLGFNKLALLSGSIFGVAMATGVFRSAYQDNLSVPIIYYGIFVGIGRILASFLLAKSGYIKQHLNLKQFYLLQISFYFILFIALWVCHQAWMVIFIFLIHNGVKWGFSQVSNSYLMDFIKNSKNKATLLSIRAQVGQIVAGVGGFILGYLIDVFDYQYGFGIAGVIFLIVTLSIYVHVFRKNHL